MFGENIWLSIFDVLWYYEHRDSVSVFSGVSLFE